MSKFSEKHTIAIKGILDTNDGKFDIYLEDEETPINLSSESNCFNGKPVSVVITYSEDR